MGGEGQISMLERFQAPAPGGLNCRQLRLCSCASSCQTVPVFIEVRDRLINTLCFGAGTQTLLAHGGFTGNYELWLQPFEILSRRHRTITYDHRGAGEHRARPEEISLPEMVADLFGVMDAPELERPVVAGESMGAAVVLQAALERPDRFEGLVLVDGSPTWTRERSEPLARGLAADYQATLEGFIERCVPEPGQDHIRRWGMHILGRAEQAAAVQLVECMWGVDIAAELATLAVPTLVIHGAADAIVPLAAGQLMAAQIPNCRLVVIEGSGHVPTLTFPETVATEIDSFMGSLR